MLAYIFISISPTFKIIALNFVNHSLVHPKYLPKLVVNLNYYVLFKYFNNHLRQNLLINYLKMSQ